MVVDSGWRWWWYKKKFKYLNSTVCSVVGSEFVGDYKYDNNDEKDSEEPTFPNSGEWDRWQFQSAENLQIARNDRRALLCYTLRFWMSTSAFMLVSMLNCSAINLLPEFQINVNNDQGVKFWEGEMVEGSKKVKVVGVLQEIVQPNA